MSITRKFQIKGTPTLGRGKIVLTLKIAPKSLKTTETPFGVIFDLEDARLAGEPGTPGFPTQLLRLALPPHSDVMDFNLTVKKKADVTKTAVFIAPIQERRPGIPAKPGGKSGIKKSLLNRKIQDIGNENYVRGIHAITLPKLEKYREILANPAPIVSIAGVEHRGVATILTLEVCPVRQKNNGIIELATEISIDLAYEATTTQKTNGSFVGSRMFRPARTKAEAQRLVKILKNEVLNPDWITDVSDIFPWFSPLYDYLIITDNQLWDPDTISPTGVAGDLVGSFQKLVDWKRRRGLNATIVTISDIVAGTYGDFKTGARDLQEVLRNFLKWAHGHWHISWVLLGGDVSIIPIRVVAGDGCGVVSPGTDDPPKEKKSFWTGSYMKMNITNLEWGWPAEWPLILVNFASGELIPYDTTGTSSAASPGWYYTTDDSYATQSAVQTNFVRINGSAALINTNLQWFYRYNRIPTDLYYSSLLGPGYGIPGHHDWDLLDNGIYGQHPSGNNVDGVSYSSDIGVGRAPVQSVAEADVFVSKVIAYEQFRSPDGAQLDVNWPRRLTMVSSNWGSNWGETFEVLPTASTPPGDNRYYHNPSASYSLIKLRDTFSDIQWHLFAVVTNTDVRQLQYDPDAAATGFGWYFAESDTNLNASEILVPIFGGVIRIPQPTPWIAVYGYSDVLAPQCFLFDRSWADGSMTDQETLRKQLAGDFSAIDIVRRLYEDEVDLPAADATTPPVERLTQDRLRDALNFGQHLVSLSGHGWWGGCCALDNGLAQSLNNGYHTFIGYADSCLTNDFQHEDSMSEDLLKNAHGGAVAYVGNTRFSWIGAGDDYQREFFKRLKSTRHLSQLNDSRFNIIGNWIIYSLNLIGDPEMPIWVGKPGTMTVTHPSTISRIQQDVTVTVKTAADVPINEAVVCLTMGGLLVTGVTDASGEAVLNITPPSGSVMNVFVTALDYVPYFGTIAVKTVVVCKPSIICKLDVSCMASIGCKAAVLCKASIGCKAGIACSSAILCGLNIVPCGGAIACNFAISNCKAGIGPGCPAIDPEPWQDIIDILQACEVRDIQELAAKTDTQQVRDVLAKLNPANRKALLLMLKRINAE